MPQARHRAYEKGILPRKGRKETPWEREAKVDCQGNLPQLTTPPPGIRGETSPLTEVSKKEETGD